MHVFTQKFLNLIHHLKFIDLERKFTDFVKIKYKVVLIETYFLSHSY